MQAAESAETATQERTNQAFKTRFHSGLDVVFAPWLSPEVNWRANGEGTGNEAAIAAAAALSLAATAAQAQLHRDGIQPEQLPTRQYYSATGNVSNFTGRGRHAEPEILKMDLDYQTAIVRERAICGWIRFWSLGQFCSKRIEQPVGRALLSWHWYALGFLFTFPAPSDAL